MGDVPTYMGMKFVVSDAMMGGAWFALDSKGRVIGSGVMGMGEHWNGKRIDTHSWKLSSEVYEALKRKAAKLDFATRAPPTPRAGEMK